MFTINKHLLHMGYLRSYIAEHSGQNFETVYLQHDERIKKLLSYK